MAIIDKGLPAMPEPNEQEISAWKEWVASRPDSVREICERLPPWHYYDMPKTGQIVIIKSYSEDGTVSVQIAGDRISIPVIVPFGVFGVPAGDLMQRM